MNKPLPNIVKLTVLGALFSLASCASLYNQNGSIPGLDRILNYFSKAEVGPVKKANGEIVQGTETGFESADNKDLTAMPSSKESADSEPLINSTSLGNSEGGTAASSNSTLTARDPVAAVPSPKTPVKPKAPSKLVAKATNNVISGKITLLARNGKISSEGLIVRLNRKDGSALQKPASKISHEINMVDKAYAPGNIVIRKGDALNFVNSDLIQHNVFSSSGENAFDLGTFGNGLQREVKLNKEGVVKVYCNIHSGMAAFVAVDDTGVSQVVKSEDGYFEFLDMPVGEYDLTIWSVRGEQTQQVTLTVDQKLHLDLSMDTSSFDSTEHANKFGETYQKKTVRREFY